MVVLITCHPDGQRNKRTCADWWTDGQTDWLTDRWMHRLVRSQTCLKVILCVVWRFYSKFHRKKLLELTETGLVNFNSLFLVLASVGDTQDVVSHTTLLLHWLVVWHFPGQEDGWFHWVGHWRDVPWCTEMSDSSERLLCLYRLGGDSLAVIFVWLAGQLALLLLCEEKQQDMRVIGEAIANVFSVWQR